MAFVLNRQKSRATRDVQLTNCMKAASLRLVGLRSILYSSSFKVLERMAPKRSLVTSQDEASTAAADSSKRPKRAAATAAIANIKDQIAAESSSFTDALAYASASTAAASAGSSSSSGSTGSGAPKSAILKYGTADSSGTVTAAKLKLVPAELVDVQQPGVRRTPELYRKPVPGRDPSGRLKFPDHPEFHPNLTPAEVLRSGSFGGYYFRPIASGVTGLVHVDAWREFPEDWFTGMNPALQLANPSKEPARVNKFKVDCGQDLRAWEESGWINAQDPFGWFQWYCRFYLGRRTEDDARQISRWVGVAGAKGRWKTNLIHKVVLAKAEYTDPSVSPVVRQTLQHWGYSLSKEDYDSYASQVREGKTTSFIRS